MLQKIPDFRKIWRWEGRRFLTGVSGIPFTRVPLNSMTLKVKNSWATSIYKVKDYIVGNLRLLKMSADT